jgi:hypothetical protein
MAQVKFNVIEDLNAFPTIPAEREGLNHDHLAVATPILWRDVPLVVIFCSSPGCDMFYSIPVQRECNSEQLMGFIQAAAKMRGGTACYRKCPCKDKSSCNHPIK